MAIRYDKSALAGGKPGRYLAEVKGAAEKESRDGDDMIELSFKRVDTGDTLCFDRLTFSQKGTGIAHKKLKALGAVSEDGEEYVVEASRLVGLRCWLTVALREFNGRQSLEPDFKAEGFGYEPWGEAVANASKEEKPWGETQLIDYNEEVPF